jgi:hypothetical protein
MFFFFNSEYTIESRYLSLPSEKCGTEDDYIWITTRKSCWRVFFHLNLFLIMRKDI